MATIRKLWGKWQAMVRRKGIDKKSDTEKWAGDLEAQVDAVGYIRIMLDQFTTAA